MGRQKEDPATVGSSIVLLQQRFKQLQRLKEMREGRQMLRNLPQSMDGYGYDEASKRSMNFSTWDAATFQDPLALGLNSSARHYRVTEPQQFPSAPHNFFEKYDVDTSLRL